MDKPEPFLALRVHDSDRNPTLNALCVGYELGTWRAPQLSDHLMEWLPEFALTPAELERFTSGNVIRMIRTAARNVYTSEKFHRRGEFGELLLHASIRQVYDSFPAISKIYYKTAHNDTVKGFDAVHVVESEEGLELWLGEAKFYSDPDAAIRDVVAELELHTQRNYLRDEFILITGKIDNDSPHADRLRRLLSPATSLDEVFNSAALPVLLTYDSDCVNSHSVCDEEYVAHFEAEVRRHYEKFTQRGLPPITVHLFLIPLKSKAELVEILDERLKAWQAI